MRNADTSASSRPANLPAAIVDAHHHLWRLDGTHYPWLQEAYDPQAFFMGDYADLRRDFAPDDYRRRMQGQPVVATVHVEAERARPDALAETAWLHQVHAQEGFPNAVVAHADFGDPDIAAALRDQSNYALVRGIRCKPRTAADPSASVRGQSGTLQDERWLQGLALLPERGLSWDLRVPFWHLAEAADAIAQIPGLTVVLNHTGLPWDRSEAGLAAWRKGMQALARHDLVHVKLSEFGLRDTPWNPAEVVRIIRDTIDIFGWQRCVFASNFPVASLRVDMPTLVDTVCQAIAHLPPEAQAGIWHDNALRVYRIDTRPGRPVSEHP